jgi:CheY-like chemotaxis protein
VARERPDLVLVDIRLARGSDGLTVAKEIRARFRVPAIAVTGHLTPEEAEAAGLLGLVAKPLAPERLRCVLAGAAAWLKEGAPASTQPFLRS